MYASVWEPEQALQAGGIVRGTQSDTSRARKPRGIREQTPRSEQQGEHGQNDEPAPWGPSGL